MEKNTYPKSFKEIEKAPNTQIIKWYWELPTPYNKLQDAFLDVIITRYLGLKYTKQMINGKSKK